MHDMPPTNHVTSKAKNDIQTPQTPPRARRTDTTPQSPQQSPESQGSEGPQRFVLTDPVAFRYLEDDPTTTVLERGSQLYGYECYIVEQWAVSRTNPTFMITAYTGDPKHVVTADVLGVPRDEKTWSPRLRIFFKALNQYHARREATPLGTLIVTNLSGFPSSLTVMPVPEGNLQKHRAHFFVNENLKRLGCLGRVGLTLGPAPSNAIAKFYQIYHTSEKNDVNESVVELVRLCQLALALFNKLEIDYADGLLCDVTEHAISAWWNDIGAEHYTVEPHDGPLGPTTVAALLGLLMGARNRLRSFGVTVPKDAFDLENMKRGISSFQKQQRLTRTRRLDRETLKLLVKATAKAAAGDGWAVPRAVKSTVAELSGRGGEMLNDVVRKRDRAGIAEIETTDYEHFIQLAYGPYSRWLWHGKNLKRSGGFGGTNHGHDAGHSTRHHRNESGTSRAKQPEDPKTPGGESEGSIMEDHKTGLRKRATDLRNEAKSGLDKIKDAVHLRHRQQGSPKQTQHQSSSRANPRISNEEPAIKSDYSAPPSPFSGPTSPVSPLLERSPEFSLSATAEPRAEQSSSGQSRHPSPHSKQVPVLLVSSGDEDKSAKDAHDRPEEDQKRDADVEENVVKPEEVESLTLPGDVEPHHDIGTVLRRTTSENHRLAGRSSVDRPNLYPMHLSFTLAEDTVLPWSKLGQDDTDDSSLDEREAYAAETHKAERQKALRATINDLRIDATAWTDEQLAMLKTLVDQTTNDEVNAQQAYQPRHEAVQTLTTDVDMLLRSERERLEEGTKELETLNARLTYEINGLRGRIEDVDHVVDDFENGVQRVEDRVLELERDDSRGNGWRCVAM